MSYHGDTSACGQFHKGDVLRLFNGPFSDGVILGFDESGSFKVARPYVYASEVGSAPLIGTEMIEYPPTTLTRVERVDTGRIT